MTSPGPQLARDICQIEGIPARDIVELTGGQVNQVYRIDRSCVLRIGRRADAFERMRRESELLRSLAGQIPVPEIYAFGLHDGLAYQIQQWVPGEPLYTVWGSLPPGAQEDLMAQLAAHLQTLHSASAPHYGAGGSAGAQGCDSWAEHVAAEMAAAVDGLRALRIRMVPGIIELAQEYLEEQRPALQSGAPARLHADLGLSNILVHGGRISALLDFEFSLYAPVDYELFPLEAFCLYPNDYAEEEHETYCSADFATVIPLLRRHYPALFAVEHLRERVNVYHLAGALRSYLAWRSDNLATIPPEQMAAKAFYLGRIGNFLSQHGARMFFA